MLAGQLTDEGVATTQVVDGWLEVTVDGVVVLVPMTAGDETATEKGREDECREDEAAVLVRIELARRLLALD